MTETPCPSGTSPTVDWAATLIGALRQWPERLSDAPHRPDDAETVLSQGTRIPGAQLGSDSASLSQVDFLAGRAREGDECQRDPAAPSHVLDHELTDFGPAIQSLRNDLPLVIDDMLDAAGAPADPVAAEVARHAHAPFRAQLTVPARHDRRCAGRLRNCGASLSRYADLVIDLDTPM